MPPPARPTLRCLREDLAASITDPNVRRARAEGKPPKIAIPLHAIEHPLLQSINQRVQTAPYEHRDKISAVTDNVWYRHDYGQWRGVVWTDQATGQSWLVYAALRREGDRSDAYRTFERACSGGSDHFLPTEKDRKRLEAELAYARLHAEQQQRCWDVIEVLLEAAENPGQVVEKGVLDGQATLSARIVDSNPGEVWLCVMVNDANGVNYRFTSEVLDMVPGVPPDDWGPEVSITPAEDARRPAGGPPPTVWSAPVDRTWIQRLQSTAQRLGVGHIVAEPSSMADPADGRAHIVRRNGLTAATVNGQFIRSLCGRRFIPTTDPDGLPVCEDCVAEHERVRKGIAD